MPAGASKGEMGEFYVKAGEPIAMEAYGKSMGTGKYQTVCTETIVRHKNEPDEHATECRDVELEDTCDKWLSFTPEKKRGL
jgi:hypothetical protein